ncbi:FUSC family protein [Paraburkholderia sp. MM5482-R1]|uniref:FUSC family protein n=1 Tax=unclassified Paraburkholderia TaxID=2615204 RepID=UPI003D227FFE
MSSKGAMTIIGKLVSLVSRRTLRAEGHVFAITPERIGITEGIHAALAMAPMLCAAAILGRSDIAFGAVAAFWNCLCDPQGSRSQRLKAMAIFTAMGVVVMPLASYAAHWGYAVSIVTLFVLVFLCGLTRSYKPSLGPMPAQAGLVASLAVVIGIASPEPLAVALAHGGYFLLGSAWTMLFCIFLWPVPFPQSAGFTLATIFGRLEDMAGFLESLDSRPGMDVQGWTEFDTVYRRGVRMSIERGRALAAHDVRNGPDLGPGVDAAGRVFSTLIAIGHARRNAAIADDDGSRQLLQGLRQLLQSVAAQAQQELPIADTLVAQAHALLRQTAERTDQTASAVAFAARAIARLADGRHALAMDPETPAPAAARAVKIERLVWDHALRVAVASVLAFMIGTSLSVTFAYWGVIAAIVVTQPVSANTWLRVLERACGSLIGATIAAVLLTSLSGPVAVTLAILPLAAVTVALRLVNYGLFVVFLTPMFMLMSDFIHPAEGLIVARLTNEFVGACVGVAASFLLWPPRESNALNAVISAAISANMAFASAALRMAGGSTATLDRLQREAGLASSRLEVARERMLLEGQRRSARLEQLRNLTVAVRVVCGAAAVIEVLRSGEPDAHDRERANRYDEMTATLLEALTSREAMPLNQSFETPADDLEQAIQHLVSAFDSYVGTVVRRPVSVAR